MINIKVEGEQIQVPEGTTFEQIADRLKEK